MSLYGALFAGVTGLNAQSQSMAMISDNLANVNTTAYKRTAARFSTLVTESGSINSYSPGGVRSRPLALIGQQGQIFTSQSDTDAAITGRGFFVVNSQNDGTGETLYTRAGSFLPDSTGDLRNTAGYYLQGWPLDANGNLPASAADLSSLETVNVQAVSGTAAATTSVEIGSNLNSSQVAFVGVYVAGNMSSGATIPHFFRNFVIRDGLGSSHELTVGYLKTGINTWAVEVYAANAADVQLPTVKLLASGNVVFNGDGSLDAANPLTTIGTYNPVTGEMITALAITWSNGASASNIGLDFGTDGLTDGLAQFDSPYNVAYVNQNGAAVGLLSGVSIDEEGFVIAAFTNGETQRLYKVPLATFADPSSLDARDGNSFAETTRSGSHNLREPGTGGAGMLAPSALESANVDIAQEFTDMIVTQRAYSANTRVITAVDEMLDELIRLKR